MLVFKQRSDILSLKQEFKGEDLVIYALNKILKEGKSDVNRQVFEYETTLQKEAKLKWEVGQRKLAEERKRMRQIKSTRARSVEQILFMKKERDFKEESAAERQCLVN